MKKTAIPVWEVKQMCECPHEDCKQKFDILKMRSEQEIFPHEIGAFAMKTDLRPQVDPETGEKIEGQEEEFPCPKCKKTIRIEETEYFYGE